LSLTLLLPGGFTMAISTVTRWLGQKAQKFKSLEGGYC